jgi:hypothetical protein
MGEKTVKLAKRELGIRTAKTGGPGGPWMWSLPKKWTRPPYPLYPL